MSIKSDVKFYQIKLYFLTKSVVLFLRNNKILMHNCVIDSSILTNLRQI